LRAVALQNSQVSNADDLEFYQGLLSKTHNKMNNDNINNHNFKKM